MNTKAEEKVYRLERKAQLLRDIETMKKVYKGEKFRCFEDFKHKYQGHFFNNNTMRFFKSRCNESFIYGTNYFITSEKHNDEKRFYTIRLAMLNYNIETICNFQGFNTKKQAENFIRIIPAEVSILIQLLIFSYNNGKYDIVKKAIKKHSAAFEFIKSYKLISDFLYNNSKLTE